MKCFHNFSIRWGIVLWNLEMIDNVNKLKYNAKESDILATVQTQIRIEEDVKKQAVELFDQLGIDMSSAVNMFF